MDSSEQEWGASMNYHHQCSFVRPFLEGPFFKKTTPQHPATNRVTGAISHLELTGMSIQY
tara:strand:- start:453 stop:632 length:180 start_codon:yes stop_codon:yes gene_type:complete